MFHVGSLLFEREEAGVVVVKNRNDRLRVFAHQNLLFRTFSVEEFHYKVAIGLPRLIIFYLNLNKGVRLSFKLNNFAKGNKV